MTYLEATALRLRMRLDDLKKELEGIPFPLRRLVISDLYRERVRGGIHIPVAPTKPQLTLEEKRRQNRERVARWRKRNPQRARMQNAAAQAQARINRRNSPKELLTS